jgi:hypothetical protein
MVDRIPSENIWSDMYIRDQVTRLREMADRVDEDGVHTKAEMLRDLADTLEKYEPVVRGIEKVRSGDFASTREGYERAIEKYE